MSDLSFFAGQLAGANCKRRNRGVEAMKSLGAANEAAVLSAINRAGHPVGPVEVGEAVGLTRQTAWRCIKSLAAVGLITRASSERRARWAPVVGEKKGGA